MWGLLLLRVVAVEGIDHMLVPHMIVLDKLRAALTDRYRVEREIGVGGMATVYLARDLRHDRDVAIKVLHPDLAAALGAGRFLAEIKTTAKLQHPHILPLLDSGEADGLLYYVMPYVSGESLRARLERETQLPVDDAVRIAREVLSALESAHKHGVVHRDIKPENILLHEDQALVADFGIALAVSAAGGARMTQTGLSLGTPAYMAPEQAMGERVIDARADIYALGAVLYEMLVGEAPFTGPSVQAIVARVMTESPRPVTGQRRSVPEHVNAAVLKSLEKLPADRFHSAHQFAEALEGRSGGMAIPSGVRTPGTREPHVIGIRARLLEQRVLIAVVAFVAACALATVATWRFLARARDSALVSFVLEPPTLNNVRQFINDFAISPDGKTIALVATADSSSKVYLRRLADVNVYPVPGTDGAAFSVFSPDGKWLAVGTLAGKLLKIEVDGTSAPMTLAEGLESYSGAAWADDETIVVGTARPTRRGLGRIAATGGAIRPLTTSKSSLWAHGFPFVAADGKTVLFMDWGPGYTEDDFLAIGSLETGKYGTSSLLAYRPIGVIDHRIIYVAGGAVMAVQFDARRLRVVGDPVRVLEGLSTDFNRTAALSSSGTLAYERGQPTKRLIFIDGDGRTQALSSDEHNILSAGRFSPDGRRIAIDVMTPSADTVTADIWTFDVNSQTFTRLTSLGNVVEPEWTTDGTRLLFTTWFQRKPTLWRQAADGAQPPEKLFEAPEGNDLFASKATPDGRGVVFCWGTRYTGVPRAELFYLAFAGERKPERLVSETFGSDCDGGVSPDGKWLAYVVTEDGKSNVFLRRFRSSGGRVQVSEGNGARPLWSRDGSRLYYGYTESADGRGALVAAQLKTIGNSVEVVKRDRVVALPQAGLFDVAPDGKHVLTLQQSDSRVQLVVTTNWIPQLRARLAAK
jgi:Tol biopolymer transport system component